MKGIKSQIEEAVKEETDEIMRLGKGLAESSLFNKQFEAITLAAIKPFRKYPEGL